MSHVLALSDALSRQSLIAALGQELSNRVEGRSICSLAFDGSEPVTC